MPEIPKIIVVCHDSPTRDDCPKLSASNDGRLFITGSIVNDDAVLHQMRISPDETVVEITPRLLEMMTDPAAARFICTLQSS
jgi:hypothetical protein